MTTSKSPATVTQLISIANLFRSSLFARAVTNPGEVNQVAFSALIAVMQNESSEADLLQMINALGMVFNDAEKAELNGCLSANNFTIQLQ